MRNIMNPTFSSAKLREVFHKSLYFKFEFNFLILLTQLNPLVSKCIDRLIEKLKRSDNEIDVTE